MVERVKSLIGATDSAARSRPVAPVENHAPVQPARSKSRAGSRLAEGVLGAPKEKSSGASDNRSRRRPAPRSGVAGAEKRTIALVYDFDGTLSPKPMQEYAFLPKIGADPAAFWAESNALAKEHAGRSAHHLHAPALQEGEGARACASTARDLVAQGRHVELYPGVEAWFDAIGAYVKSHAQSHGVALRHYLISSGLDRDHRGHLDLQALPQRVRLRILVRGLRPALPQARHHRHRQDAVPVPHQQGRRGPGREHQPAHARGRSGRSRSPT